MQIQQNIDLLPFNTFKVKAEAAYFTILKDPTNLESLRNELPTDIATFILGEGANLLFTKDYEGLIVKNELTGKKVVSEDGESVLLEVNSGENWHELVMWSVKEGWSGLENMAYIPGTVGAAPVQNIAAYGQNFEDVFVSLKGIHLDSGAIQEFNKTECKFTYRESIFKNELRGKFLVTSVQVKLSKKPQFATSYHSRYESVATELAQFGEGPYSPLQVAEATIALRKKKLPDWHTVGTAGSFFKNPVVTKEKLAELQAKVSELQFYPIDKLTYPQPNDETFDYADHVKVPAGRLLDELGWKGKRIGEVGTFDKQALAVVNYGGASGKEILDFTNAMKEDVAKNYDIELEREVIIL